MESERHGVHVIPQIPYRNFKLRRPTHIDHCKFELKSEVYSLDPGGQTPPQCGEMDTNTDDAGAPQNQQLPSALRVAPVGGNAVWLGNFPTVASRRVCKMPLLVW